MVFGNVVARAGLGWNLFLEQISPLPGDGWRDAPCRQRWGREEAAAASHLFVHFIGLQYMILLV